MKIFTSFSFTIFLFAILICFSCTTKSPKSNHSPTILSIQEIDDYMNNWMKTNKTGFDWKYASNEILHSALMQSDSLLSICYKLTPDGSQIPPKEEKVNGIIPDEWKKKAREIMQYVLEKEQKYRQQPNLTLRDILPYGASDKGTCFYIKITDPTIIQELRKDKTIKSLASIYEPTYWFDEH